MYESSGSSVVNSSSKLLVSNAEFTSGLNGGSYFFPSSRSQSISAKNCCDFISVAPLLPSLYSGSRTKSPFINALALDPIPGGKNGGSPVSISNNNIPNVHQSTVLVYPCPSRSSGAKYSGVPQKVFVFCSSVMFSLHSPKSQSATCPL
ncbi:hypothetical protein AYI69_g7892 [Smittium culicis]|uniref:Uncharacterized protein n=1 Tax=Smittium culicis TaxID=133412 RepID=A0A1R1XNR7_9FUNG|nr:hypothetical protein AYI69_g9580 [Smittium culicis]OMJ12192.1 hypothetical protein AYI69_g9518 [Smittium culicis]OMJ16255.1 hypothetical protein AYI69_g7892 [Smittium culicis]